MFDISEKDRLRLRDLARHQAELAAAPEMQALKALWYKHNDCEHVRPMVVIELGTFKDEMITPRLQCEGETARSIEAMLLSNTFNHEYFHDDFVVPDYIPISTGGWLRLFNHNDPKVVARDGKGKLSVGHQFIHLIHDLEEDYDKIENSVFGCDAEGVKKRFDDYTELLGDILPVRWAGTSLYSVPTQKLVHMMSMEVMYYALCDCPELFEQLMDRLANDTLAYFDFLEEKNLLLPTVDFEWLGQGTYCATKKLPGPEENKKRPFKTTDIWGFMDSQETVSISPAMYEEYIFPTYQKISSRYGALSYGCCEPVHPIWDSCLSKLKNLRRVSISPWCDEDFMAERLRGTNIVYHRKLNPNFIGVGDTLDEDAARAHVRKTIETAHGCEVELTQRDVYTVKGDIDKVRRYVEIIREESENHRY